MKLRPRVLVALSVVTVLVVVLMNLFFPVRWLNGSPLPLFLKDIALIMILACALWLAIQYQALSEGVVFPHQDDQSDLLTHRSNPEDAREAATREAQLDLLLTQLPEGVIVFENWRILYANQAAIQILGFRTEQAVFGRHVLEFVDGASVASVKQRVAGFLSGQEVPEGFIERRLIKANGSRVTVEIAAKPLRGWRSGPIQLVIRDVSEQKEMQQDLESLNKTLTELSTRALSILEDERKLLAYELHDEIGQVFVSMSMQASLLLRQVDPDAKHIRDKLEDIRSEAIAASKRTRNLAMDLRPPQLDEMGLNAAIEWQLSRVLEYSEIRWQFDSNITESDMTKQMEVSVFRIVQEAVTNVVKHAGATALSVILEKQQQRLSVRVIDNGTGADFAEDTKREGLGMLSIAERAKLMDGAVSIESSPGLGTKLTATIPLASTV